MLVVENEGIIGGSEGLLAIDIHLYLFEHIDATMSRFRYNH